MYASIDNYIIGSSSSLPSSQRFVLQSLASLANGTPFSKKLSMLLLIYHHPDSDPPNVCFLRRGNGRCQIAERKKKVATWDRPGPKNAKVGSHLQCGKYEEVVGRRNGYAVFKRMPAHVQNLLVEVNLICISLLAHPLSSTNCSCRWAASS